jgi:hypothetical membrane protein
MDLFKTITLCLQGGKACYYHMCIVMTCTLIEPNYVWTQNVVSDLNFVNKSEFKKRMHAVRHNLGWCMCSLVVSYWLCRGLDYLLPCLYK